jgi:pimeloyl-ACP methyl ester carboxylesterase
MHNRLHAFAAVLVTCSVVVEHTSAFIVDATTTKAPTPAPPPTTPSPTPFPLPAPAWGACPSTLSSLYQSCATVFAPQHWATPADHANVTFFLGRVEPSNAVAPNTTVWYLGDDCTANGLTQWISSMLNLNFYIVSVYTRGSVYGTPSITCPPSTVDPVTGWPLPACGVSLTQSGIDASVFSFTEMAYDLKYIIPKLGSIVNVVFADGIMTNLAQRLQVIQPDVATSYVLSGFSAPDRYDAISSTLDAFETVARRILQQCIATAPQACVGWFGGQDPWQVWAMTLEAAAAGVLPCTKALQWNVVSYRDALASIAAMLVSSVADPFTQPSPAAVEAFFPAFIYRLQRCDAADVTALTALYTKLNATAGVVPNANPQCATNSALWFNLLTNELLQTVPTVAGVLSSLGDRKVQPSSQYFTSVASVAASWPKYTVPAAMKVVGAATQPTALIAGDGDVFSPIELAQYAVSLFYAHAQFTVINRGQHPLLSTEARSCVISILSNVATTRSTATVPSCGGGAVASYDFVGSSTTASILVEYFSVDNLWAYTVPMSQVNPIPLTPPAPGPAPNTPTPGTAPPGAPVESDTDKKAVIALALLLVFSWLGVAVFVWIKKGKPSCFKQNRDFYSALNDEKQ